MFSVLSVLQGRIFYSAFLIINNLDCILLWNIVLMPSLLHVLSLSVMS